MTRNILEPTAAELDLLARVAELEADVITLAEHGTLDLSDREDALGRLDRELARQRSDSARWASFHATCPTGTAAGLSEAFQFPPPPFGDGAGLDDDDHELAAHAASWEG